MKPVLTIHEVNDDIFNLPLHEYILTFDDGLYTQYMYIDQLLDIDTPKYFFISTNIVAKPTTVQSTEYIKCHDAHNKFFHEGCLDHYMNWSQIKEIGAYDNCTIGGHGHGHKFNFAGKSDIIKDITQMMSAFTEQNISIKDYAFPYNNTNLTYKEVLKKLGVRQFFSDERKDINEINFCR